MIRICYYMQTVLFKRLLEYAMDNVMVLCGETTTIIEKKLIQPIKLIFIPDIIFIIMKHKFFKKYENSIYKTF